MAVTPAGRTDPPPEAGAPTQREAAAGSGLLVALLAVVLATWLVVSSFALGYPPSDPRSDAFLNEALAAIILAVTALGRMLSPTSLVKLTVAQGSICAWLIAAPHVIGYGEHLPAATANALISGIAGIGLAGYALAFADRRARPQNQT